MVATLAGGSLHDGYTDPHDTESARGGTAPESRPEGAGNPHITRTLSRCALPNGSEAPGWVELLHAGG